MEHKKQCRKCGGTVFNKRGFEGKKQRYECLGCGFRTVRPYLTAPEMEQHAALEAIGSLDHSKRRYLVTSAQNATEPYAPFFSALEACAEDRDAEIVVLPFRYRNPNSLWSENDRGEDWWHENIEGYLYSGRDTLGESLLLLGDIPVVPTATNPLSGLDTISGDRSGILGHPKLTLKAIPTPQNSLPKIMVTTGACTVNNYTASKAGKKGEFHHTFGAALVELDNNGKLFHLRQINAAKDGSFIDLETKYTLRGAKSAGPVEAIVMGDVHVDYADPEVVAATITNEDSMINVLKPKRIVLHDIIDFYSRSHHSMKDPFIDVAKRKENRDDVLEEIIRACEWVDMIPKNIQIIIVPSNHHDHIYRWMKEADWKKDAVNAEMYLETALHMVREARMGEGGAEIADPFLYWAKRLIRTKDRCVFLERDDSFMIKDIEVGMHGDVGANGGRGSGPGMARMGVKSIFGHTHTPMIYEGAYWAGTSSKLRLDYNHGASSWLNSHVVIYPNGKRSIINIIDGKWRLS